MAASCASVLWRWSSRYLLLREEEEEDSWSERAGQQRHESKDGTYRQCARHAVAEISRQRGVLERLVSDVGVLCR
jgi:hypothetical protein